MRKLALTDEQLLKIEKPARYLGNEINAVMKDKASVKIRFAICFPDVYEIGMSHLGIQILYDQFNRREDTWCERVYSPWTDLDKLMREERIPLFALESQDPVREFDFFGITIQYEMCYTNILQVLDLAGIPLSASERTEEDPIVIGGGPCVYNPEPIAEFFDLFYIGEGETVYDQLFDLYREYKEQGRSRREFLEAAAGVPGIYVPGFYEISYREDGTIDRMIPINSHAPATIRKEVAMDLNRTPYPDKPLVPFIKVTQDRVVLEVQRGCIRGCRFCQAGMVYRPLRERSVDFLKEKAVAMLKSTGQEEISLSSLSSSDYSHLAEIVDFLMENKGTGVNISLPSLRIDAFSLDVMSKVQDVRKSSVTFAPEAGTQRMRDTINKGLTEEVILSGAAQAFRGGWNKVKLYFMLGLPTETVEDMEGISHLANKLAAVYYEEVPKEQRNGRVQITVSTSFFVPKPFIPFQWAVMCSPEEYERRARIVSSAMKNELNHKSLRYSWHDPSTTILEGILARGDRRVAKGIRRAYEKGCIFDAWTERFDYGKWLEAFRETGIDLDFYTMRERALDEVLPWDFIDTGVSKRFLKREWERALAARVSPNCRKQCQGCGAKIFGGGVCDENQGEIR